MISIKKGIDLPISGRIESTEIKDCFPKGDVAVLGDDYIGLRPTMSIIEGQHVTAGDVLFEDKKNPGVVICAPVSGIVREIRRGERRRLLAVVIEPDEIQDNAKTFTAYQDLTENTLDRESVIERLRESGMWPVLRTRPFSKVPALTSKPHSIFVNTMDSNPLSFNPVLALAGREKDYLAGLQIMQYLTEGFVHVCRDAEVSLPKSPLDRVKEHEFTGIHPVGLVGTHIHFIDPVGEDKQVWHIKLQDLLAIGKLFTNGTVEQSRIVAIAGPGVKDPCLVRTIRGIDAKALLVDNLQDGEQRVISGSVFSGRKLTEETYFLGGYDQQISVLPESGNVTFLEFFRSGANSYSRTRAYLGRFLEKQLPFTTAVQGSPRAILPYGIHDEVMPLDILPTLLLKALAVKDTDTAIKLGALELDEEDMALLTYVDPGKNDFGAILRENLMLIEQEG